jgi:DNA-directed RNA polymerase subunit RPC12/RpoP
MGGFLACHFSLIFYKLMIARNYSIVQMVLAKTMTSLLNTNPALAKEWHPTKNAPLTPEDVTPGSHKKAWWICGKGHEWEAQICDRNRGTGCPYCSGRLATKGKNLLINNPRLAKEWHPTKNAPLTPKDVTPNSNKKAWWRCSKDHEWEATVNNRNHGKGCPYCSGQMVCIDNCLATVNPALAKDWHPTKNAPLTPEDVTPNSAKKVWWICSREHEWEAVIYNRNRGTGCPYCSGRGK